MADEYIRKNDAVDAVEYANGNMTWAERDDCKKRLEELSPADVVPVRHGKWLKEDRGHVEYDAVCSVCGFDWMWSDRGYFKFCPGCGAKMDGHGES